MTSLPPAPIFFHGPGLLGELHAARDDHCLLKFTQTAPIAAAFRLEVLLPSLDERGIAGAFWTTLFQHDFAFSTSLGGAPTAFVWLPANIPFALARRCYYRVTTCPSSYDVQRA